MKTPLCLALASAAAMVLALAGGCGSSGDGGAALSIATPARAAAAPENPAPPPAAPQPKKAPAPAKAEKPKPKEEPLLLLDEKPKGRLANLPPPTGPVADNSRCHVCHANYADEEMAVLHARANVGCARCHGPSDEHCGDEGNVTAPTTLIPKEKIDPSCLECHPENRVVDGALYCIRVRAESDAGKYCTECHGQHKMAVRSVHWDPVTGKLLPPAPPKK